MYINNGDELKNTHIKQYKIIKTELEVEIFYERLSHFYDCCKGGKSLFSEFSENVVDSDNIFSEVAQFL